MCFRKMDWHVRLAVGTLTVLIVVLTRDVSAVDPDQDLNGEAEARSYMEYLNGEYSKKSNLAVKAEWSYASNLTEENLQNKVKFTTTIFYTTYYFYSFRR